MTGATAAHPQKDSKWKTNGVLSLLRNSAVLAGILAGLILVGFVLMCAVYCLPVDSAWNNIQKETDFIREGFNVQRTAGQADADIDSWTDALMLITAVTSTDEPAVVQAMLNRRYGSDDEYPHEVFVDIFKMGKIPEETTVYSRYWHGYLVVLKPLLMLFTYNQILYINMLVQLGLMAYLIYTYIKSKKGLYCIPLIAAWIFLNPITLVLSIHFSPLWIVTLCALSLVEKLKNRGRLSMPVLFMITGAAASYFDLLTFPLITLGAPLAAFVCQIEGDWKNKLLNVIGLCVMWSIGYFGMWAGKIFIGELITNEPVLADAVANARFRAGREAAGHEITYPSTVKVMLLAMNTAYVAVFAAGLCVGVCRMLKNRRIRLTLSETVPYLAVCVLPLVWVFAFVNHTFSHTFFTYRMLGVTIYGVITCLIALWSAGKPKDLPKITN